MRCTALLEKRPAAQDGDRVRVLGGAPADGRAGRFVDRIVDQRRFGDVDRRERGERRAGRCWPRLGRHWPTTKSEHGDDPAHAERIAAAWEAMMAAQGSDWFWWYGSDQDSGNDAAFDDLFRRHVRGVYESLGLEVPMRLLRPIVAPTPARPAVALSGLSAPVADGWADFQEWDAAAALRRRR